MSAPIIEHQIAPHPDDDPAHPIPFMGTLDVMSITVGGGADLFPGVGSVYGSILPGVVLSTSVISANGNTAPASFSTVPTYLADAPFINRTWGQTSFNTMNVGFKWRFNDTKAAWGHARTCLWGCTPTASTSRH